MTMDCIVMMSKTIAALKQIDFGLSLQNKGRFYSNVLDMYIETHN